MKKIIIKWFLLISKKLAKNIAPSVQSLALRLNTTVLFIFSACLNWMAGQKELAERNLRRALERSPDNVILMMVYAKLRGKIGRSWQQLEFLEENKQRFERRFFFLLYLGWLQLSMHHLSDAYKTLLSAIALNNKSARAWWLLGVASSRSGDKSSAYAAYAHAERCSWNPWVRKFGVGVFFTKNGMWGHAVDAYTKKIKKTNSKNQMALLSRRAHAYEQQLNWNAALQDYKKILGKKTNSSKFLEKAAFASARLGNWVESEKYCNLYLSCSLFFKFEKNEKIRALLAWVKYQQGANYEAALEFKKAYSLKKFLYIKIISKIPALIKEPEYKEHSYIAQNYIKQARIALKKQNLQKAAQCLEMAVQRWPSHSTGLIVAWAGTLAELGDWDAACAAFNMAAMNPWPKNAQQKKLERKRAHRVVMEYTEYLERLPLKPETILYESYAGVSLGCNPYSIFLNIIDSKDFYGWTHVWVVNDISRVPSAYLGLDNVIFVARGSQLYQRYLSTATWLINNSTFPPYFIRREGQQYLNTWHGTPLKHLGKDIRGNFMEHKNTARNFLQATHIISPNSHTSRILIDQNDIQGIYQGWLKETGYPRNDLIINAGSKEKEFIRSKLGIVDVNKPVVLYAPTWRGSLGQPEINAQQLIEDLTILQKQNCQIVFRGHYFAEKKLAAAGLKNILVAPQAIDTSELLAVTDVLITDYSSIFFDYLATGRPIIFYTYDLEKYSRDRGLYFDMAEMPGPKCQNIQQLSNELAQVLEKLGQKSWVIDAAYQAAQMKFSPFDDGRATDRAIDFFFKGKKYNLSSTKKDTRKTLLFFIGPFTPMGITTAAINLISALDEKQYRIVIAIDPDAVGSESERMERLRRLPGHVQIIARVGRQVCSAQERVVIDQFHRHDQLEPEQWPIYAKAFEREFQRVFGNWQPDCVINYDGYARFWAGLLAFGPENNIRRLLYLHNDMYAEWQVRFPHLAGMFALYPKYDLLISVAEAISQTNQRNLAEPFGIPPNRFLFADNMPDVEGVRAKAQENLDDDLKKWLANVPKGQSFVSIGRLSPEKNHALLLNAFSRLIKKYPQAKLTIAGDGVLRKELEKQIQDNGLQSNVLLAGMRNNPFPLLNVCDCFVLPSKHEGQPMVLLEAMVLEKSIVATQIPGVTELLKTGYGNLVKAEPEDLVQALMSEIENPGETRRTMDFDNYKMKIINRFISLVEKRK